MASKLRELAEAALLSASKHGFQIGQLLGSPYLTRECCKEDRAALFAEIERVEQQLTEKNNWRKSIGTMNAADEEWEHLDASTAQHDADLALGANVRAIIAHPDLEVLWLERHLTGNVSARFWRPEDVPSLDEVEATLDDAVLALAARLTADGADAEGRE